ncbi:MAG: hypothetical protein ACLSF6_03285 [Evtepia gabavorous]
MSDNLNIKLLKQHAAILETALQTVNNVSKSITEEAAAWMRSLPRQDATDALVACERAGRRFAEAKLSKAVADLRLSWPVVTLPGVCCQVHLWRATANPVAWRGWC